MSLKEIFCQANAIDVLQRAYASDKSAHAYIFAGADGIGKFKTASEWAKLLLCQGPVTKNNAADSCGKCQSCKLFDAGSHPDFGHVYKELIQFTKDGKDKKTPIDLPKAVIREFLIDKVSARPGLSQRKVFVVSEAEKLNAASQNSLLKVLEEPPAFCSVILLCTHLEKLLPTTKSRCQIIRFGPIDEEKIIDKLTEAGLDENVAKYFSRLSDGSIGQAYQWAQLELADAELYETKKRLIESLAGYQYPDSIDMAEKLLAESKLLAAVWSKLEPDTSRSDINRRAHKAFIRVIISALQDAMKLKLADEQKTVNFDQQKEINILANRFAPEQAAEKITDAANTMRWIDYSVNEKLIFENLFLNLVA